MAELNEILMERIEKLERRNDVLERQDVKGTVLLSAFGLKSMNSRERLFVRFCEGRREQSPVYSTY